MKKNTMRIMMRLTATTTMMIMKMMKMTTMMIEKGMDKHNPQESGQTKHIFHGLPYFTHCKNLQWKISGNVYLKCSIKYSKNHDEV